MAINFDFASQGDNILVGLRLDIPGDYHAYAHDPGGTGLPTDLDFTVEGEGEMPVLYPDGLEEADIFDPTIKVNVYYGTKWLMAILPEDAAGKNYTATLEMLFCSSRNCVPFKRSVSGAVPMEIPELADVPWGAEGKALLDAKNDTGLSLEDGSQTGDIADNEGGSNLANGDIAAKEKATGGASSHGATQPAFNFSLEPQYVSEDLEIYNIGKALLLGLVAGLLLNAMPCVLPVLTMKVTGLLLVGNMSRRRKIRRFRQHNLCFAAGVMSFFTLLAILLGVADLMWGQLYQNQAILLIMLLLVFLMGLSMLGVFTLPALDLRLDAKGHPAFKAYATGFISTFLATPCSGPLLGGVLAWAFTQSLPVLVAVFWAVGFGMALPYLAFSIWPNIARILPRPGNWMYVFEHILGFLLLATALYLLSILPPEKHMQILSVLLLVALCAWLWGRFCGLNAPVMRRRVIGVLGILLLVASAFWVLRPVTAPLNWINFSPQAFMSGLGKKNMLVEFTADWCPNCKFLEATVLSSGNMRSWQKKYGLELVKVDLTQSNEYAQKLLRMLGGNSIPLTAIFPRGEDAAKPMVLRDLYGAQRLDRALKEILGGA